MNQLKSKRILVVGGSSGIGAATASAFAELGADVLIVSRNAAKLAETAAGIGNSVSTAVLDTTNAEAVEAFFATAGNFYGYIRICQPINGRTTSRHRAQRAFQSVRNSLGI
jgi:NAD(P)-dependent dehydrogenase (short-subunit alcohol dehydrogenase family)